MAANRAPSPVKDPTPTPLEIRRISQACAQVDLATTDARLIHRYANEVWLLPKEQVIARVTHSSSARQDATLAVEICTWLHAQGFPAVVPHLNDVITTDASAVTFWRWYPQSLDKEPNATELGHAIKTLHQLPTPPVTLPTWQPLATLESVLRENTHPSPVNNTDRDWLLARIDAIRSDLDQLDWPLDHGLIHADAWAGNLLWDTNTAPHTALLCDWDTVCQGPRVIDLIPTWHAAFRFGRDQEWTKAFAKAYGHDLTNWPGLAICLAMRDLVQLVGLLRRVPEQPEFRHALRQRLDGIKTHNTAAWNTY